MRSSVRLVRNLAGALFLVTSHHGLSAEEASTGKVADQSQVVVDPGASTVSLNKGYFYVAPLSFMPSKVVVGQPDIVGVDVVGAKPFPHIHLIGLNSGATNLVVFDQSDKIQVAMRLSVREMPGQDRVVKKPEGSTETPSASPKVEDSAVYSIRVYRALAGEELNCSESGCNIPKAISSNGKN